MIKNFYSIVVFLILILIIIYSPSYCNDYENNTIVVKFDKEFSGYSNWVLSGRSGEIQEFIPTLAHNNSRGFISNSNITLLENRKNNKFPSIQSNFDSGVDNIKRICVICYDSQLEPSIAARKISSMPGVEYAEPLFIHHITGIPDDSLADLQSHLNQIKAFDAWDILDTNYTALIGIIDTGVDYLHPDLGDNLYFNPGETGLDSSGRDKRNNYVDDDKNGFVDDWFGWDFVSDSDPNGDNLPFPGNEHGTHVAGICAATVNNGIGIAGVAKRVKYMPVKVAPDNESNTAVTNGYDGIIYAAGMGADIINCSWGSSSKSEAEQEILDEVANMGSLVVAAAGNDGRNIAFYPSSHDKVLSVAAVDSRDVKAGFSNFHTSVDVSAPGVDILSTLPDNQYGYLSGTSMATPVVSGVAALVKEQFPTYKPIQIIQQIKLTTDNIDTLNKYLTGQIGTGRVNALRALTSSNLKSVLVKSYNADDNNDRIFDRGDTIRLKLTLMNVLHEVNDGWLKMSFNDDNFIILKDNNIFGKMLSLESKELNDTLVFVVPKNIPSDSKVILEFRMYDDTSYCNSEFLEMTFRPTYRTMNANNITITFNNIGNIGFNDYPNNNQGDGFKYKDSPNLLFEGALMVGTSEDRLSNVARGLIQSEKDRSFLSSDVFRVYKHGDTSQEGFCNFYDLNSINDAGVIVNQKVYQFNDSISKDFIIIVYDIINNSGYDTDSMYAALFLDWDIGPSGSYNQTLYENSRVFGYTKNVRDTSYPMVGVCMLSKPNLNFIAIDNGGDGVYPGIWDGFPNSEKWVFMSSGMLRQKSRVTDASMVIGAGPIKMMKDDTARVTFSIFGGKNLDDLIEEARLSREKAFNLNLADSTFYPLPILDTIYRLYPNPVNLNNMTVDLGLANSSNIKIEVIDIQGKIISVPVPEKYYTAGYHSEYIPVQNLSQGRYFLKLTSSNGKIVVPFEKIK
ncbi:MAG: S8 family serine peptidase [Ignavibacteriae bacterium]|nr:S8 family serine peptidase [Ignavibacteriota bacterium]